MTAETLDRSTRTGTGRSQWLRVAKWQLQVSLFLMLWAWSIALLAVIVILAIVSRYVDIETSSFAFSHHGLLWFPFSIAILLSTTYLPLHVANGMTRRSFIRAALLANVATGLSNAAFSVVVLLIERAVYDRLGWVHAAVDQSGTEIFANGVLPYGAGLALLFVAGMLSGLVVGVAYYRFGAWWGTLALPLTLLPIVATAVFGLDKEFQWTPWGVTLSPGWPVSAIVGLAILAATAAAFSQLTRRIPLSTRKA